jgi:hypothetical protein
MVSKRKSKRPARKSLRRGMKKSNRKSRRSSKKPRKSARFGAWWWKSREDKNSVNYQCSNKSGRDRERCRGLLFDLKHKNIDYNRSLIDGKIKKNDELRLYYYNN